MQSFSYVHACFHEISRFVQIASDCVQTVSGLRPDCVQIASALRSVDVEVQGIYLIRLTSVEGYVEDLVRVVCDVGGKKFDSRDFVHKVIELRRNGKLPELDQSIRIDCIRNDHLEAKRIADYTRKMKKLPLRIKDVFWDGLYIEYALVAEMSEVNEQAA